MWQWVKNHRFLEKTIVRTISKINSWLPKQNRAVIKTYPDFESNGLAVYNEMIKKFSYKIIWLVLKNNNNSILIKNDNNTIIVNNYTLKGLYYLLTSRYIFFTHGFFAGHFISQNQILINLWHGMPVKAIGLLDGKRKSDSPFFTWTVATSSLYQDIMARCMGVAQDKVLVVGHPRNDLMFQLNNAEVWQRTGINRQKYHKVFFWLPTYRQWQAVINGKPYGKARLDGQESGVFALDDMDIELFETFLRETNSLCLVKPHPAAPCDWKKDNGRNHVLFIDESWLNGHGLNLYHLLSQVDCLLTDISSIWIDFLILGKPMIFCFPDLDEYRKSRKIILEPYEEWIPGPLVKNFPHLLEEMRQVVKGEDTYEQKRKEINCKVNSFTDGQSSLRLLKAIGMA
jgi:CDP-glycerol glycerophosphotransferase